MLKHYLELVSFSVKSLSASLSHFYAIDAAHDFTEALELGYLSLKNDLDEFDYKLSALKIEGFCMRNLQYKLTTPSNKIVELIDTFEVAFLAELSVALMKKNLDQEHFNKFMAKAAYSISQHEDNEDCLTTTKKLSALNLA